MNYPKIIDDDSGKITAELDGEVVRSWWYQDDEGHKLRMHKAHEFVEGWFQGVNSLTAGTGK